MQCTLSGVLSALLFLTSMPLVTASPLLKGEVAAGEPVDVSIVYDFNGDNYLTTVKTDNEGRFEYDTELPVQGMDVMVYVNSLPFGAYVKNGTTTVMTVNGDKAVFFGDNVAESNAVNAYCRGFYPMNFKPSPDVPFVYTDYMAKLEAARDDVKKAAAALDDDSMRGRLGRLADTYYNKYKLMLMSIDKSVSNADHSAETDSIVATIDPNADESRLTGIITYWYNASDIHKKGDVSSIVAYMIDQFGAIDRTLTNEGNKKSLWNTLGSMFMMYQPSDEDIAAFWAGVEPQMSKAPMVRKSIMNVHESMTSKVKDGDPVPTDPTLIAPDGSKCRLSELIGKTVVYIDIWATWCGPCCREIPYMDKLVERFKDNPAISFISISRDDNRQAWLKKLERDNPQWPQYIFDKTSGDEFMSAMAISGIPRFLLIGGDGRFISIDAIRPSAEKIDEVLEAAIAGNK